jgi:hypothetical protein
MFTGKDALILFYGIFLATIVSVIGKYRLFETHLLLFRNKRRRYALFRFLVAFFFLNVIPIFWIWVLYNWIVPETLGALPIIAGAFASLSVFGFNRILHAIIATEKNHSKFYSEKEWEEITKDWGERWYPNTFVAHFFPGIGFLILYPLIAYVVGHL